MAKAAHLQMQFEDMDQQSHAAELGMWTFLATEVLFFGTLFACYTMLRLRWEEAFREGSHDLKIWIGGINTAVLLTSSTFMALAVRAVKLGHRKSLILCLSLTAILGLVFLGLKSLEYYEEYQEMLIPNIHYADVAPAEMHKPPAEQHHRPHEQQLFMLFYFIMTAFHALHMIIGISVIVVLIVLSARGRYGPDRPNTIEIAGLYWHFVDLVWVFLYPALYLLRQG